MVDVLLAVLAATAGAAAAAFVAYRALRRDGTHVLTVAKTGSAQLVSAADHDAQMVRLGLETAAREEALDLRHAAERELAAAGDVLVRRDAAVDAREQALEAAADAEARAEALRLREEAVRVRSDGARASRLEAEKLQGQARGDLERLAGATAQVIRQQLIDGLVDEVRAEAAQIVRVVDQNPSDPEWGRQAKRIMGIAMARYQGH